MPHSRAYRVAEKLIILSAAAEEAMERRQLIEFNEVMDLRQAVIDEICGLAVDKDTQILLEKVKKQDLSLRLSIERAQQETLAELAGQFRESRGVKAYRKSAPRDGFQRVG